MLMPQNGLQAPEKNGIDFGELTNNDPCGLLTFVRMRKYTPVSELHVLLRSGGRDLRGTQVYPKAYGRQVCALHESDIAQEL